MSSSSSSKRKFTSDDGVNQSTSAQPRSAALDDLVEPAIVPVVAGNTTSANQAATIHKVFTYLGLRDAVNLDPSSFSPASWYAYRNKVVVFDHSWQEPYYKVGKEFYEQTVKLIEAYSNSLSGDEQLRTEAAKKKCLEQFTYWLNRQNAFIFLGYMLRHTHRARHFREMMSTWIYLSIQQRQDEDTEPERYLRWDTLFGMVSRLAGGNSEVCRFFSPLSCDSDTKFIEPSLDFWEVVEATDSERDFCLSVVGKSILNRYATFTEWKRALSVPTKDGDNMGNRLLQMCKYPNYDGFEGFSSTFGANMAVIRTLRKLDPYLFQEASLRHEAQFSMVEMIMRFWRLAISHRLLTGREEANLEPWSMRQLDDAMADPDFPSSELTELAHFLHTGDSESGESYRASKQYGFLVFPVGGYPMQMEAKLSIQYRAWAQLVKERNAAVDSRKQRRRIDDGK